MPACTKPDPGVARNAFIFLIAHIANSCFRKGRIITHNIKTFSVAVELQGILRTNQCPSIPDDPVRLGGVYHLQSRHTAN